MSKTLTEVLRLRVSPDEKRLYQAFAQQGRGTLAQFMRTALDAQVRAENQRRAQMGLTVIEPANVDTLLSM